MNCRLCGMPLPSPPPPGRGEGLCFPCTFRRLPRFRQRRAFRIVRLLIESGPDAALAYAEATASLQIAVVAGPH